MRNLGNISTFRAFRNPNYALFFAGQSVSLIGTWMQRTAVSWVVFSITHSNYMLGLTIFASQFPSFVLSLWGGIIADRHSRHKILLITQTASMVQAILLSILILTGHYVVWEILTLSTVLGIINAFDVPARQPLVHDLVNDPADLPNALALNTSMANLARLIGPALSGIVLIKLGAGACFLMNALSFAAVLGSLLLMKLKPFVPAREKNEITKELKDGFQYLVENPAISKILILLSLVSLFVMPYDTLLPVFAKVVFKGDAATFGYISSFTGLGAIIGTIFLASLKPGVNLKLILLVDTLLLSLGLMAFSHLTNYPGALGIALLMGFGGMGNFTVCLTIIQVNAAAHMRGRLMSYIAMAVFGMLPLGSLLIGALSEHFGAPDTILVQGIAGILISLFFSGFLRTANLSGARTK